MKLVTANKLNRFWKNGVVAKMVAKTKILKTMEEVTANTNDENVAGAGVVAELNDKVSSQPEWIQDSTGKITGYKTPGGADTVFPFNCGDFILKLQASVSLVASGTNAGTAYPIICVTYKDKEFSVSISGQTYLSYGHNSASMGQVSVSSFETL